MTVALVVPVKNPVRAKSRLVPLLGDDERRGLVRTMLDDVLTAARRARGLAGIFVVADGPYALPAGVNLVEEPQNCGYDAAIATALADPRVAAAGAILVLPADLPEIGPADIDAIAGRYRSPGIRVAPARDGDGTNALLIAPPDLISTAFGPGSFMRHHAVAEAAGVLAETVTRPGLAFDIDTPHDLVDYCARDGESQSLAFLRRSGVADRLRRSR